MIIPAGCLPGNVLRKDLYPGHDKRKEKDVFNGRKTYEMTLVGDGQQYSFEDQIRSGSLTSDGKTPGPVIGLGVLERNGKVNTEFLSIRRIFVQ